MFGNVERNIRMLKEQKASDIENKVGTYVDRQVDRQQEKSKKKLNLTNF